MISHKVQYYQGHCEQQNPYYKASRVFYLVAGTLRAHVVKSALNECPLIPLAKATYFVRLGDEACMRKDLTVKSTNERNLEETDW